jgi:hypothetical protein
MQVVVDRSRAMHGVLGWGVGIGLTLLLGALFSLAEPSLAMRSVSGLLLIGWAIWGWFYPQLALACLLLTWLTLYQRANLPLFQVEGGWNRGGLSLGDLLWLIFMLVWLLRWIIAKKGVRLVVSRCMDPLLLLLVPYLGLAILLPILGVLIRGWQLSYAMPGALRPLQWVSFTLFGYWLIRRYGSRYAWHLLLKVFALASVLHALHAFIQALVLLHILPGEWLALDYIFAQRFPFNWIDDLRATGLFVNPNNYGLFGAIVLLLLGASILARALPSRGVGFVLGITGAWAIASSASRTAAAGLIAGWLVMGIMAGLQAFLKRDEKSIPRVMGFALWLLLITFLTAMLLWLLLPDYLLERINRVLDIAFMGSQQDTSASGRLEAWKLGVQAFEERFPFGTWVPSEFALGIALDNHYMSLMVEGTPFYLGLFIMLLGGIIGHTWRTMLVYKHPADVAAVALAGCVALVAAGSFTLAPLREIQVLVPFWFLLGLNWRGATPKTDRLGVEP